MAEASEWNMFLEWMCCQAPLERKKATEDMARVLLEDVMKSFLMGNVMTIPKIRDSEAGNCPWPIHSEVFPGQGDLRYPD